MSEFSAAAAVLPSDGLTAALASSGLGQPELWSVLSVETSGCGFLPGQAIVMALGTQQAETDG
jgi:hypothetical protein